MLVNGHWYDSTSQSITINSANFNIDPNIPWEGVTVIRFGADESPTTCRVNGPSGVIACSVADTSRVAFYGRVFSGSSIGLRNETFQVCASVLSWRDDRGQAHFVSATNFPATVPLCFFDQGI